MNTIPFQSLDIYEFFCDSDLIDKVMTDVTGPNIFWKTTTRGNESSTMGNLDDTTPFYHPELFKWIQDCIDQVAEKHFFDKKLTVVDAWLTKNIFGQRPVLHSHVNSVISGLLYFSTFNKSGTVFTYLDPWHDHISLLYTSDIPTKSITVNPEKGKLILWRSDIEHTIEPHTDMKKTRYTLAFNAFFDGIINSDTTRKLEIKVSSVKDQYEEFLKKKNG